MRRVVFASDLNWDYAFFLPLTARNWQRVAGFTPLILLVGTRAEWEAVPWAAVALRALEKFCPEALTAHLRPVETLEPCTLAQAARLVVASQVPDPADYLLTADADMWALSPDYFTPTGARVTQYSAQAYGDQQYPLCYAGADVATWREIMGLAPGDAIRETVAAEYLAHFGNLRGDRNRAWDHDEHWWTRQLKAWHGYPAAVERIGRPGSRHGLMSGRVDRAHWVFEGLDEPGLIDAHLVRPGHTERNWGWLRRLYAALLPDDAAMVDAYRREFCAALEGGTDAR